MGIGPATNQQDTYMSTKKPSEKDKIPQASQNGRQAFRQQGKDAVNPYKDARLRRAWNDGFQQARQEANT
jgi:hypothetical protein